MSSNQLAYLACTPGENPILEGSVGLCANGNVTGIDCRGYFASFFPEDTNRAVIVLDLPEESKGGGEDYIMYLPGTSY